MWPEKFPIDDKRPWLKNVPKIKRFNDNTVSKQVAVNYYLKWKYGKKYNFLFISGKTSIKPEYEEKFWKKVDYVYNGFMDLNSAGLTTSPSSIRYRKIYSNILKKYNDKLIIPYSYQEFTTKKCEYYTYAKQHGIPIVPYKCILPTNTNKNITDKINEIKNEENSNLFVKPSGGYASRDVFSFNKNTDTKKIVSKISSLKDKYAEVVLAKKIAKFDTTLEVRFYYYGNTLSYILANDSKGDFYVVDYQHPKANYYKKLNKIPKWITNKPDIKKLKRLSNKTFKVMKEKMNGAYPIVTRLDFGCCNNGKYFFNEIEYAPGLLEWFSPTQFNIDKKVGDAIIKSVKKKYSNNKK